MNGVVVKLTDPETPIIMLHVRYQEYESLQPAEFSKK